MTSVPLLQLSKSPVRSQRVIPEDEHGLLVNIDCHFDGSTHATFFGKTYRNPTAAAKEQRDPPLGNEEPRVYHRDILRREALEPVDVERGIDPYDGRLGHFLVQAAPSAYTSEQGPWRRTKMEGNTSKRLRLAGWILGRRSSEEVPPVSVAEITLRAAKILFTSYPLPFMSLMPFPNMTYIRGHYLSVPARSWTYPKHVRNMLDASPAALDHTVDRNMKLFDTTKFQDRQLRPRQLVVYSNGMWTTEAQDEHNEPLPYLFISYTNDHFHTSDDNSVVSEAGRHQIEATAQRLVVEQNVKGYYLDFRCRAEKQPELTDDIHRLADVIRGARDIWIILPSYTEEDMATWGSRMWTLAEGLLASRHRVMIYSIEDSMQRALPLLELPRWAWVHYSNKATNKERSVDQNASLEDFRLLAEHFTGTLNLSRIELTTVALRALRSRKFVEFQPGDRAYALMAFLQYRPAMDPSDSEFQALARLSLKNDSDRIVERMVCLLPQRDIGNLFTTDDALNAKLHEIEPITQIAGVCHDDGLIVDGCRGISIHWHDFPYIKYVTRNTLKRKWSCAALRFGAMLWLPAISLLVLGGAMSRSLTWSDPDSPNTGSFTSPVARSYTSALTGVGVFFLVISLAFTFASPWLVVIVFGGKVWNMEPWLIGFEGTMPIKQIERMMFSNAMGRLSYSPSGSIFSRRDVRERVGVQPDGYQRLPPGHKLFTLVDTGSKTVTLFSAKLPPTAALICGKEGGMLRTLLCSYDLSSKAYIKQSVIRMETPALDMSVLMSWVKIK